MHHREGLNLGLNARLLLLYEYTRTYGRQLYCTSMCLGRIESTRVYSYRYRTVRVQPGELVLVLYE